MRWGLATEGWGGDVVVFHDVLCLLQDVEHVVVISVEAFEAHVRKVPCDAMH
jgi:hypothetical protein